MMKKYTKLGWVSSSSMSYGRDGDTEAEFFSPEPKILNFEVCEGLLQEQMKDESNFEDNILGISPDNQLDQT